MFERLGYLFFEGVDFGLIVAAHLTAKLVIPDIRWGNFHDLPSRLW
jgi:hypothetical protein